MSEPINKFDVTVTFDDGAVCRLQSRKDVVLSREDVLRELETLISRVRGPVILTSPTGEGTPTRALTPKPRKRGPLSDRGKQGKRSR